MLFNSSQMGHRLPSVALLMAVAALLSAVAGDGAAGGRSDMGGGDMGGIGGNNSVTAVQPGEAAKLACHVPAEMYGSRVSWIRRKDLQLLSVGESMYTNDHRLFVSHSRHSHSKDSRHSQMWFLHMMNVTKGDEGEYECQVSTHPHFSFYTVLKVQNAYSQVEGPGERVVAAGSGLRLVCVIKGATEPPAYIFWFQNERMVNFDANRGVNVTAERDRSVLTVGAATDDHAGNYTCQPSNAWPASVLVHVVVETTESGASKGPKVGGKTPVQLGVKSASSDGPRILPQTLALFLLGLLLDALTFPRVFHTRL
ncbi:uncharacterized protein LOC125024973 [Penaeus chinensis]|uniref:uncharacterized protein LOC125024973 n=1 Tax=Penaeus chinensis TaxID=139456 RepID=UPI001FB6D7E0|nr:uncharacterized protein LOC125024973 [Penaeus chinensis]